MIRSADPSPQWRVEGMKEAYKNGKQLAMKLSWSVKELEPDVAGSVCSLAFLQYNNPNGLNRMELW
jgi:hypothetical protein